MDQVTLYVPCYNAERYLKDCLEAVLRQTHLPDEILVIDDGSTDHTAEIASKYPVRLIRHPQNKGLGAACNTAISNSRNELVASISADVAPAPDWLERLVVNIHHDGFAGGGGKLVEKFQQRLADQWRAVHMPQDRGHGPKDDLPTISGSNTIFKASAIKQIGLYNEAFRRSYEDHDLCERLRKRGFRLYYRPDAVCYHLRQDTIPSAIRTRWGWIAPIWHRQPFTLHNLLRRLRDDVRAHLRDMLFDDVRHFRLRLVGVDLLSLCYFIYADLRHHLRGRRGAW